MALFRLFLLCLALVGSVSVMAQDEETIDWFDNYQKALAEAKRTNKPIFLEFRCEA